VVLETRHKTGGAADTMAPWPEDAPDIKVTTLGYVMSLMPPSIQRDLLLDRFGYKVHPQGMGYLPLPDGSILQSGDARRDQESISRFSTHGETPPRRGSKKAGDIKDIAHLGWQLRKDVDERTVADITRLFSRGRCSRTGA
jgi:hypothetical protein